MNGREVPKGLLKPENLAKDVNITHQKKLGILHLFSGWYISSITLIMFFNCVVTTMCYYGLGLK